MNDELKTAASERLTALMEMQMFWGEARAMAVAERKRLEADGYSPTAAEQMSQILWMSLVAPNMTNGQGANS